MERGIRHKTLRMFASIEKSLDTSEIPSTSVKKETKKENVTC